MFQEAIGKLTSEHLREHIDANLTAIEGLYTGQDMIHLPVPTITDRTLVGGVITADIADLPIMGVDCVEKNDVSTTESLYLYQYQGAIVGLISAANEGLADRMVKRYNRAAEQFVRDHQFLHLEDNEGFMMREFIYVATSFSGSMEVELEEQKNLWVAGFTCNVLWFTSEDSYRQH